MRISYSVRIPGHAAPLISHYGKLSPVCLGSSMTYSLKEVACQRMVDDAVLNAWFCQEVLPLERALTRFIRRNWRSPTDVMDLRQEVYERVLVGARGEIPQNAEHYIYTIARNHLINCAKRAQIVSS